MFQTDILRNKEQKQAKRTAANIWNSDVEVFIFYQNLWHSVNKRNLDQDNA